MGQAKTRGTLEQRKALAVERQEQYRQICIAQFRAREAAIPLAKRQRIAKWLGVELAESPDHDPGDAHA